MKRQYQKGFSLIEVIIVVLVIGILTKITLSSISSAKSKSEDAAAMSLLTNMRQQAEYYKLKNGNYGPTTSTFINCPTVSGTANIFQDNVTGLYSISKQLNEKVGVGNAVCGSDGGRWLAAIKLKSGKVVCNDSQGNVITNNGPLAPTTTPIDSSNNYCR